MEAVLDVVTRATLPVFMGCVFDPSATVLLGALIIAMRMVVSTSRAVMDDLIPFLAIGTMLYNALQW